MLMLALCVQLVQLPAVPNTYFLHWVVVSMSPFIPKDTEVVGSMPACSTRSQSRALNCHKGHLMLLTATTS